MCVYFSHRHVYSACLHYPISIRAIDPVCLQAVFPVRVTLLPSGMLCVTNIPSINCNDTLLCSELNGKHAGEGCLSLRFNQTEAERRRREAGVMHTMDRKRRSCLYAYMYVCMFFKDFSRLRALTRVVKTLGFLLFCPLVVGFCLKPRALPQTQFF